MRIENLSKEVDTKAMTAVRGGVADSANMPTALSTVKQGVANVVGPNAGIVQIDTIQNASVSQSLPYFANWGLSLFSDFPGLQSYI